MPPCESVPGFGKPLRAGARPAGQARLRRASLVAVRDDLQQLGPVVERWVFAGACTDRQQSVVGGERLVDPAGSGLCLDFGRGADLGRRRWAVHENLLRPIAGETRRELNDEVLDRDVAGRADLRVELHRVEHALIEERALPFTCPDQRIHVHHGYDVVLVRRTWKQVRIGDIGARVIDRRRRVLVCVDRSVRQEDPDDERRRQG